MEIDYSEHLTPEKRMEEERRQEDHLDTKIREYAQEHQIKYTEAFRELRQHEEANEKAREYVLKRKTRGQA